MTEQWEKELAVIRMRNNDFMKHNQANYVQYDSNNQLRLRTAIVGNSRVSTAETKDPLDMINSLNQANGTIAISYMNGVSGTGPLADIEAQKSEYIKSNNTYNFNDRKFNYNTSSTDANIKITSPYIWTGKDRDDNDNWCGFNYVPLQNSIAILGNKETGQPLILNYIPSNPSVLLPALKPGEIAISGYGNNYLHFSQSDKITLHCESKEGKTDMDDPNYLDENSNTLKTNVANCTIDIQANANDRMIKIIADEDSNNPNIQYNMYNADARKPDGKQHTKILITPTDIEIVTMNDKNNVTTINITDDGIICKVADNETSTTITQSPKLIKQEYTSDNCEIQEEITEDSIYREVKNKQNGNVTLEQFTSDNYYVETKKFEIKAQDLITLYSEDCIDILNKIVAHDPEGSGKHVDDKAHKITIKGCNVKVINDDYNHGEPC